MYLRRCVRLSSFWILITLTVIPKTTDCAPRSRLLEDYSYSYSIQKPEYGLVTHHWEKRSGPIVTGGYSMLDPNGKVRVVEYHVDGRHGFKAYVQLRRPPGNTVGHLRYPLHYRTPIRLAEPVSLITPDLFRPKEIYPNLPQK